jgi:cohesin complex subunit SA-1/2
MIGIAQLQDLLWSFIHAMRSRVMDAQHAGVMLSQYGRLDGSFDAAMPSLVEILQEEGMYNKDSDMVTHVAAQALQQVRKRKMLLSCQVE